MADKKITALTALTDPTGTDLLLAVDDPSGTPISKSLEIEDMFGASSQISLSAVNISSAGTTDIASTGALTITATAGATVTGTLTVSDALTASSGISVTGNSSVTGTLTSTETFTAPRVTLTSASTPSNNNTEGYATGTIFWDTGYVYVVTGASEIKRVALSTF